MHIICQMKAKTTRNTQKIHQKSPRQPIYTNKRQTHRTATSHTTQRRNLPQKGNLGSIQGHPTLRSLNPSLKQGETSNNRGLGVKKKRRGGGVWKWRVWKEKEGA